MTPRTEPETRTVESVLERLERLAAAACPGPAVVSWPVSQGDPFLVIGKQGTRAVDFTDGWAIPLIARGVESNMALVAALWNALPALIEMARAADELDGGWHAIEEGENVRLRYASDLPARLNALRTALQALQAVPEREVSG